MKKHIVPFTIADNMAGAAAKRNPPRILLVEDEKAAALQATALLRRMGYDPFLVVESGEEAILRCQEDRPDLILADIMLAGQMDGIALAEALKDVCDAPLIFMTAHDDRETLDKAARTMPSGFLVKPLDGRCLHCAVEVALFKTRAERKFLQSERKLRMLFEGMFNAFALFELVPANAGRSSEFRFLEVNAAFEQTTGLSKAEVEGRLLSEALPGIEPYWVEMLNESAVKRTSNRVETYLGDLNQYFLVHVYSPAPGQAALVLEDVTERKRSEQRLRHRTFHDPLTLLPNRALCLDRINRAIERARRRPNYLYAVIFLDLDRFKLINDSLGHPAGDKLLRMVAERLLGEVRRLDTVARVGGDEFALVLEEIGSQADALRVARKVRDAFELPFVIEDRKAHVTASLGVVLGPADYERPEELLQNATIAMGEARKRGFNRIKIFNWAMRERAERFMDTETSLRRALENHELFLNYQPIYNLNSGNLAGFEALVRWRRGDGQVIAPGEFIPVAEETGLIIPMGLYVMRQACADLRRWTATANFDSPPFVSVNLSGRQFSQTDLVKQVVDILRRTGIDPRQLKLEITESVLMGNPDSAMHKLRGLRDLGARIAVDDFGTGYSSLSYLQSFPVDMLKVDRSFVSGMGCVGNRIIVKTVVNLGHGLGHEVVAEGVETAEHASLLREMGCDFVQGFYYNRPLEAAKAEELVLKAARDAPRHFRNAAHCGL